MLRTKQQQQRDGDGDGEGECNDYDVLARAAFGAEVLKLQSRFEQAETVMRGVVSRSVSTHGCRDSATAAHMYTLATILNKRGQCAEALDLYHTALTTQEEVLGAHSLAVANTLNNIGVMLVAQDRFEEAEGRLKRALEIRQAVLGSGSGTGSGTQTAETGDEEDQELEQEQEQGGQPHADIAASLNNLAGLHDLRSEYELARPLYQQALQQRVRLFSKHHPAVAQSMNNLAQLQVSTGDFQQAERWFRRTLRVLQACYGPDHPEVAACMNNLAGSLEHASLDGEREGGSDAGREQQQQQQQRDEALSLHQEALRIRLAVFGDKHSATAQSLNNLAGLHYRLGHSHEAVQLYRQSLDIKIALHGEDSTDIAESRNNIAMLHMAVGALVSAAQSQEQAVQLMQRLVGPRDPRTVNVKGNLGVIYRRMRGRREEGTALVAAAVRYLHDNEVSSSSPDLT